MTVIEATSYTSRMLVDGTWALTIHFEPQQAMDAQQMFSKPGTSLAVARLVTEPEKQAQDKKNDWTPSQWLAMRCKEPEFQRWLTKGKGIRADADMESVSINYARMLCDIQSRSELDTDPAALARFEERIRKPWAEFNRA